MSKNAPTFRAIPAPLSEVDDAALARLNDKLGLPTMVASATAPTIANKRVADAPKAEAGGHPTAKEEIARTPRKPAAASMAPRSPVEKLTIELPGYLTDALKRYALDRRTTARHVVMLGLQALGLKIEPEDLVPDARRIRKPAKP